MRISSDTGEAILSDVEQAHYDDALAELDNIHAAYAEMIDAYIGMCVRRGILPSRFELDQAMEGIGESFAGEADHALSVLADMGFTDHSYTPPNDKQLREDAYKKMLDAKRPKPLNTSELFHALRPFSQNPETLKATGKL